MNYPVQQLINLGAIPPVAFPTDSRYFGSATLSYATADGQSITYLARRFVPQPGAPNYATVATHTVKQGDRLDLLAANYLSDPLMYWMICDANGAIRPNELIETPGEVLNITTPQGVPGVPNA
jgi:hypothetical protein